MAADTHPLQLSLRLETLHSELLRDLRSGGGEPLSKAG